MKLQRDIRVGRLFFRFYATRGPGIKFCAMRRTFMMWLWRLMIEVSWLHRGDCQCDECIRERDWESYYEAELKAEHE